MPVMFRGFTQGKYLVILLAIVPLFGAILVGKTLFHYFISRKYGEVRFHFAQAGALGGYLRGYLEIPKGVFGEGELAIRLIHQVREVKRRNGKTHISTRVIWQKVESKPCHLYPGVQIPIELSVPFDAHPTSRTPTFLKDSYQWVISFEMHQPGLDFSSRHLVPIDESAESRNDLTIAKLDKSNAESINPEASPYFEMQRDAEGLTFNFTREKGPKGAGILFLFGLFFLGFPLIFIVNILGRANAALFLTFGSPLFLIFAVVGLGLIVASLIHSFGHYQLRIGNSELIHTTRLFGLKFVKKIPFEKIYGATVESTTRIGEKSYYDIKLDVGKKLKMTLASQTPDRHHLGSIAKFIEERIQTIRTV